MAAQNTSRKLQWGIGFVVLTLTFASGLIYQGCSDGPFGRFQMRALNAEQESDIGLMVFNEIMDEVEVIRDEPPSDAVERVGKRLAEAAANKEVRRSLMLRKEKFDWSFRLVKEGQANAFCIPGGRVIVFTGILPVAKTEGGLAAVMGHEIGHALVHHGSERMSEN